MPVQHRIVHGPEFVRVANELRAVDASLPTQLRREMRDAVKPHVQRTKQNVRAMPTRGRGHTGLRREVARGVRISAGVGRRRGAYIRVITSMAGNDKAAIPRGLDTVRGWRHPVFGNTDNWVQQTALRPGWFLETMANSRRDIEQELANVLERARDRVIAAGGGPSITRSLTSTLRGGR